MNYTKEGENPSQRSYNRCLQFDKSEGSVNAIASRLLILMAFLVICIQSSLFVLIT